MQIVIKCNHRCGTRLAFLPTFRNFPWRKKTFPGSENFLASIARNALYVTRVQWITLLSVARAEEISEWNGTSKVSHFHGEFRAAAAAKPVISLSNFSPLFYTLKFRISVSFAKGEVTGIESYPCCQESESCIDCQER